MPSHYCPITGLVDGHRRQCERSSLWHEHHWADVDGTRWHWSDTDKAAWPGEFTRPDWVQEQRERARQGALVAAA